MRRGLYKEKASEDAPTTSLSAWDSNFSGSSRILPVNFRSPHRLSGGGRERNVTAEGFLSLHPKEKGYSGGFPADVGKETAIQRGFCPYIQLNRNKGALADNGQDETVAVVPSVSRRIIIEILFVEYKIPSEVRIFVLWQANNRIPFPNYYTAPMPIWLWLTMPLAVACRSMTGLHL